MSARTLLLVCIFTIVVSSFGVSRIQTSGGSVSLQDIRIPTQNGQLLVADLFKPRSATEETPAPLIVVVPGFQRSKEALSNIALELARRGFVVISIDPYAQGQSSSSMSRRAATTEGYGMFAIVEYAAGTPNLNYVDKTRIAATGHSAGGNAAIRGASHFGLEAQRTGEPSKLHSVFVSGYVLTLTDDVLQDVRSNVGMSYAYYDEGAYRNELRNADMRHAPEALRLVNSGIAPERIEEVELGRYYGDLATRTLRVVHNERILHPFQPYMVEATANQIEYFEKVFSWDSQLSSRDQLWQWKEFLSLVSLVASMVALVPLAKLMLQLPVFSELQRPVPPPLSPPDRRGKAVFWLTFVTGALIACFSYIPMTELSKVLFVAASSREMTWFFPQRMNNAVVLWAFFNGVIGFLLFYLVYRFFGRARGARPEDWGIDTSPRQLGLTLALAFTLFALYYLFLFALYYILHVDYRFLFMGVRVFRPVEFAMLFI